MTGLYLEAHITISPIQGTERTKVEELAKQHGFKLAYLILVKDKGPDQPSERDTFMTGHSKNIDELVKRTKELVIQLAIQGFKVWRYKIESCVLDSRTDDVWLALDKQAPKQPLIACDGCSS